jgi:hypothetical protein
VGRNGNGSPKAGVWRHRDCLWRPAPGVLDEAAGGGELGSHRAAGKEARRNSSTVVWSIGRALTVPKSSSTAEPSVNSRRSSPPKFSARSELVFDPTLRRAGEVLHII